MQALVVDVRTEEDGAPGDTPIYLYPEAPFWFVPSPLGDAVLRLQIEGCSRDDLLRRVSRETGGTAAAAALDLDLFLRSVQPPPERPYPGRGEGPPERLSELWIHLTDACNLRCRHCLFPSCSGVGRALGRERVLSLVEESRGLGCRLICFTGGEPLMHPGFTDLLGEILKDPDLRVAVLTNGTLLPDRIPDLGRLDTERLHFQVSLDGPPEVHDAIRGAGTFRRVEQALALLAGSGIPRSVAMAVSAENLSAMEAIVQIAAGLGVPTVHYLWHFVRGTGEGVGRAPVDRLAKALRGAAAKARERGVLLDNLEAMRAQVFSPVGTRYDLGNAAWESIAVGPDGAVYPTPAMVDLEAFRVGSIQEGLERVWRGSPLLDRVRSLSLIEVPGMREDPWRFILGGGDLDHCCVHRDGARDLGLLGADPYAPLYREMARMLIQEETRSLPVPEGPGLILRMGDVTTDCPSGRDVNFTHSNCLLSVGEGSTRGLVRQFYDERADAPDETILNPVPVASTEIDYIPEEARVRLYGCGSPVADAGLVPGEVVVDLGSGAGVECFVAARELGPAGLALGVDMSDAMLRIAARSRSAVRQSLGYLNTHFLKGYLEALPLADDTVDVVVSNCVVNLSHHKRRVFREIFRILKPGGRLVISDVVAETEPPLAIRADHRLVGECIGGAMVQGVLFGMLRDLGFVDASILKRYPYRETGGHPFFSLTFRAWKPHAGARQARDLLYAGPFRAVLTEAGEVLERGVRGRASLGPGLTGSGLREAGVLDLDPDTGAATNLEGSCACACYAPAPREETETAASPETGCLLCGEPLVYFRAVEERTCARCGELKAADAACRSGHFVCDACHMEDPLDRIRRICTTTRETDMLRLFREVRSEARVPLNGPEHHAIVPGVVLAAYRNAGGRIGDREILEGIERGTRLPGGACAFLGTCGAAAGVGIAFSILLGATPVEPRKRQAVQGVVAKIIERLARRPAARCCRRDGFIALREAAWLSRDLLPLSLRAEDDPTCDQYAQNAECLRSGCPLYPGPER